MFDIFYTGAKPNLFAHESPADDLTDAAAQSRTRWFWFINGDNDYEYFDFTWRSDKWEADDCHIFPDQWCRNSETYFANKYTVSTAAKNYKENFAIIRKETQDNWVIPIDAILIPTGWHPDPMDPPYIYKFSSKYQRASGVEYHVPGATEEKYVFPFEVQFTANRKNWIIPDDIDQSSIDFTWRPDSDDHNYHYIFPSKYQRASGVEYHVPGATESKYVDDIVIGFDADTLPRYYIETTIEDLISSHPDEIFWALNKEMEYSTFDFSWRPDDSQRSYLSVFGSQWQKHAQTFFVNTTIIVEPYQYNFVSHQQVKANSASDIFFIDRHNEGSVDRFASLQKRFPSIIKVRFASDIISTLSRCSKKAKTNKFWAISSENDYTDFNFDWHAEPWQSYLFHVFGSENQKWSDTYLVNKGTFDNHMRWCKDIKDMPDLHFVSDQQTKAINVNDIYMVDFGQYDLNEQDINAKTTRFNDSYLAVIKRIVAQSTSEYIWLVSNICDYSDFDFDWRPEPYQATMLHVFRSNDQKFGDTFLIHVPTFKDQMSDLELLDWFETVSYSSDQIVPRLPYDAVPYTGDDLTSVIKSHRFNSPYALFHPVDTDVSTIDYDPSVWRLKDRSIHTFTESGSVVLAPKDSIQFLATQCYDYPQIMRQSEHFLAEKPLNIVFVSNGESTADAMYDHLVSITKDDPDLVIKRISGVNGRSQAYKACAEASDTDWFFNVFAKLEVDPDFDFHWQPDRLQEPKHYIFNAKNPINGLVYGHQGMIAYNKKLVLETDEWGLDFTLSKAHEVIPVLSGIARYDTDAWIVWRTAFRECIKLYAEDSDISRERLHAWHAGTNGEHGIMSQHGATDAYHYFTSVNGDYDKLLLTFEWDWLREYYTNLY